MYTCSLEFYSCCLSESSELNYAEKASSAVLCTSFSPSGTKIAYLSTFKFIYTCLIVLAYDANLTIVDLESKVKDVVSLGDLPMLQIKFLSENLIVTTGHNYSPIVIGMASDKW